MFRSWLPRPLPKRRDNIAVKGHQSSGGPYSVIVSKSPLDFARVFAASYRQWIQSYRLASIFIIATPILLAIVFIKQVLSRSSTYLIFDENRLIRFSFTKSKSLLIGNFCSFSQVNKSDVIFCKNLVKSHLGGCHAYAEIGGPTYKILTRAGCRHNLTFGRIAQILIDVKK